MRKVIVDTTNMTADGFQKAIDSQHKLALRTTEAIRKVVLLDNKHAPKTELDDFPPGRIDPQMQLLLMARNEFLQAEDPAAKLGFYKAMRDVFQAIDERSMEVMDLAMRERHHKDKIELLARAKGVSEPTEAEVEAAITSIETEASNAS